MGFVLADEALDKAVKAKMLLLPSEASLAEQAEVIQPLLISEARKQVKLAIAEAHQDKLLALYQSLIQEGEYRPEAHDIAERSLKNTCLGYLTELDQPVMRDLAAEQYQNAGSMTDRMAALVSVVNAGCQAGDASAQLLEDFLGRFKDDAVVMDSWFMVQASSPVLGTLDHVKALMAHDAFDAGSPNKLRSLIGGFAGQNMTRFHAGNGEGYEFLADMIIKLDKQNPQVAARLMTPLTRWKKFEPVSRERMKKALERIKAVPDLSTDIFEVVTKSL